MDKVKSKSSYKTKSSKGKNESEYEQYGVQNGKERTYVSDKNGRTISYYSDGDGAEMQVNGAFSKPDPFMRSYMDKKIDAQKYKSGGKVDMPCNKPRPSTSPGKKRMVKGCEGGQEKIIHFGAKGYGHNYSDAARKSFKARHNCDTATSKLTARYWACKNLWAGKGGSTAPSPKGRRGKY